MTRLNWSRASRPRHGYAPFDYEPTDTLAQRAKAAARAWAPGRHLLATPPKPKKPKPRRHAPEVGSTVAQVAALIPQPMARSGVVPVLMTCEAAREHLRNAAAAVVYADGGAMPGDGRGGWGAVIETADSIVHLSGSVFPTTNNRMEITAALRAIEVLPHGCPAIIASDSQYVVHGASKWLAGWKRKGWRRSDGRLLNADLWQQFAAIIEGRSLEWTWCRGHSGIPGNEAAHALATAAMRRGSLANHRR